jgi:4-amino-4-deoxy-L-arabinose transferase-like glycosyltransferase
MTSSTAPALTEARALSRPRVRVSLTGLSLAGISVLAAVLNFVHLDQEGYANTYYAATVKSMLQSWHNFFFVSFDPAGFVAADKPPLGLWIQTGSAKLFGFGGVSMLAPQAAAGVVSVIVLYWLVARVFGRPAGLLAALILAVTPIAVVDNRNNSSDSVLVLALLLSAWAVMRAVESGRLRWLILGAVFVGLGFNIKELEAYLIVPALVAVYLAGAPHGWLVRLRRLVLAGMVLVATSFAWIVAVDLTPASGRPFVSDSGTNSELSLALGYNGLGRLATGVMSHLPSIPFLHLKIDFSIVPGISMEIGNPSLSRLFQSQIGAQASWFLVCCLVGLILAAFQTRPQLPMRREHLALLFWGSWLLTLGVFFSVARFYHLYYLIMLAPAVAALAGIGIAALWRDYREGLSADNSARWKGWLLPLALIGTAVMQAHLLADYSSWNGWLAPAVVALAAITSAILLLGRLGVRFAVTPDVALRLDIRAMLGVAALGVGALLLAPGAFATDAIANGNGGAWLPQAGPSVGPGFGRFGPGGGGRNIAGPRSAGQFQPGTGLGRGGAPPTGFRSGFSRVGRFRTGAAGGLSGGGFGGGVGAMTFAGSQVPALDPRLLKYLSTHRGGARYLVATPTSSYASLFILDTGQPVMTLGGYQGWDKILTRSQLSRMVAKGTIRFFLLPSASSRNFGGFLSGVDANLDTVNNPLFSWVRAHCVAVPTSRYQTTSQSRGASRNRPGGSNVGGFPSQGPGNLYDCASVTRASN